MNYENLVSENNLKNAFEYFDKDHNGYLTPDEIREVLGLGGQENDEVSKKTVEEIIKEVDLNGDGIISYEEFRMMMISNRGLFGSEGKINEESDNSSVK